ncbi:MAG: RHS repeat protein [Planctomycetes bacterium]|nr:RHS repeat protein [Planctomycetota bacterium]
MRVLALTAVLSLASAPVAAAELFMGERSVDPAVPHRNAAEVAPGIRLANGSFHWEQTDLATAGRVRGLSMRRVYRSDMDFDGPLGQGWTGDYFQAAWREPSTGDIKWHDADGFLHTFVGSGNAFVSPPGVYVRATWDAGAETVKLRRADGTELDFTSGGQLSAITDRHGNAATCQYDTNHRLTSVTDDRGCSWEFEYDGNGRICQLVDHVWETSSRAARVVEYAYDSAGCLATVKLPETAGYNETGENRVCWAYGYDADDRLCAITAPNEVHSVGPSQVDVEFNNAGRVVSFRVGDTVGRHYLRCPGGGNGTLVVRHVDARGMRTDYTLDVSGHAIRQEQYTGYWAVDEDVDPDHDYIVQLGAKLRSSDPDVFALNRTFNSGHELTRLVRPSGASEEYAYPLPVDVAHGSATSIDGTTLFFDRAGWASGAFAGGFLRLGAGLADFEYFEVSGNTEDTLTVVGVDLEAEGWSDGASFVVFRENPDPVAGGNLLEHRRKSSDTGQTDVVRSWTYEPFYQQVRSETSPLGQVTTYEYEFDATGDPQDGDLTFKRSPEVTVLLPNGSTGSGVYETAFTWNSYGQLTATTDPEGSVEVRHYYASGDLAGFLEDIVRDYGGLNLTERFEYDKTGVLTGQYSPRAFETGATASDFKTSWEVNELSQRWHESGHLVAGGERTDIYRYFDATGNEVRTWREYLTSTGSAPPAPSDVDDPDSFSKSATPMAATWVETARTFDPFGRPVSETIDLVAGSSVETATRSYEYDASGNEIARISPLLARVAFAYDERGLVWQRIEGATSSVEGTFEFDYDLDGRLAAERTPLGNETLHIHDGHGREVEIADPAGHSRLFAYDAADQLTSATQVDDQSNVLNQTEFEHDELGRQIIVRRIAKNAQGSDIEGGAEEARRQLDGLGHTLALWDGAGRVTTFGYDAAGRPVTRVDAAGNQVALTLDAEGNPTRVDYSDYNQRTEASESAHWEADYNTLGCITAIRDRRYSATACDNEVTYAWDGLGRLVGESHPGGLSVAYSYDLYSRATGRQESDGIQLIAQTNAEWDRDDRCITTDTEHGPTDFLTVYAYDARNRLIGATRPDQSTVVLDYDLDSNLVGRIDESGTSVEQQFDARGLLIGRDIDQDGGTRGVTCEAFEYDGAGRLTMCEAYGGEELIARSEWTWNTLGKAETFTQTVGDGNGATLGQWTTAAQFDVHAVADEVTFSNSTSLDISRDTLSRVATIADGSSSHVLADCLWAGPARLVSRGADNGVSTELTYQTGNEGPVARVAHTRGSEVLWGCDRMYDVRGLAIRERRDHEGGAGRAFIFDGLRRPVAARIGAALGGTAFESPYEPADYGMLPSFTLDVPGNRTGSTGVADRTVADDLILGREYTMANSSTNQYGTADDYSQSCDAAGRTSSDAAAGLYYAWDFRGRLALMDDSADFATPLRHVAFDALGRRVLETESDSSGVIYRTVLLYGPDGDMPIEEIRLSPQGTEVARVQYALGPTAAGPGIVAERRAGGWVIHHEDQDGSLIGLTDEDGNRVAEFDYLPFGTPLRRGVLLDVRATDVETVEEDTPVTGSTRITLSSGGLATGTLAGRELAISVPGAASNRYRTAAVSANGSDTIDVLDEAGLIAGALLSEGAGFVVLAARLATGAPSWSYDAPTDTSTFTVSGAGFGGWLLGGQLTPDVTRPAYLEIIQVDLNGNWLKVRGDATGTSDSGDHYRALPPVGVSQEDGSATGASGRYMFRGHRYDPAVNLASWSTGVWSSRSGLYVIDGRSYEPRIGRFLTPGDDWRNEYAFHLFGSLEALTPPTAARAIAGIALPSPACPVQRGERPAFRCVGPGSRAWFE